MNRMKKIIGTTTVHDGDFIINEMIDLIEENIRNLRNFGVIYSQKKFSLVFKY
jgi:hypothetical protein